MRADYDALTTAIEQCVVREHEGPLLMALDRLVAGAEVAVAYREWLADPNKERREALGKSLGTFAEIIVDVEPLGVGRTQATCPDCEGTGEYRGSMPNRTECKRCGGGGSVWRKASS